MTTRPREYREPRMNTKSQQSRQTYSCPFLFMCGSLLSLILIASTSALAAGQKPNVVLILADDLGWMDVAAYAARVRSVERSDCYYETPHIDAHPLARPC